MNCRVEIVLEQLCAKEEDCKAIGFYLLKSDGTLSPAALAADCFFLNQAITGRVGTNRKVISTPTKFIVAKTTFINKPHSTSCTLHSLVLCSPVLNCTSSFFGRQSR
jgi:hypothetical protein